ICGMLTTEGAPHLKEEHYPVFDTANKCGKHGTRYIHYMGHIRMMAAAQPFLSGAISKTINMPEHATRKDIQHAYWESWKYGLKAISIYRDGSKSSQPLNSKGDKNETKETDTAVETDIQGAETVQPAATSGEYREFIAKGHATSERRRLPRQREGFTQEARIAGQKIFVRTGEYEDGSLGELFIDMHKAGTTMRGMLDAFAVAVSLGLQHGVPLEKYVDAFTFTRFEPAGVVDHPNIKMATSVVDYVFRMIGMEYLGRKDFVQVPPADEELRYYQNKLKQQERKNRTADVKQTATQREMEQSADKPTLPQLAEPKLNSAKVASNGAPICTECGGMTKQSGTCYVCLDCGSTTGCS
ncbi:MAG: vitamin B12-dependent ribonucleotide reductase, partial [Novibacillus thermophilus]